MSEDAVDFSTLLGKTLTLCKRSKDRASINMIVDKGGKYELTHRQECCESVSIEDIIGDLKDLIGSPLTMAEGVTETNNKKGEYGTWTFYKLATIKGYVTIRFYGESNGYYSETAELYPTKKWSSP